MKLAFLRSTCGNERTCPNINLSDRNTVVVQGYVVNESAVEIPLALVPEIVAQQQLDPRLTLTEHDTVLVHGQPVTDLEALQALDPPHGEAAVEVPLSTFPPEVLASAR
ncbi:hypothetical protein ACIA8G_39400 [Lentzea sp. NPDC051213]|uniref:hypothetical protein n=1 Tax=Lentzea sp. NPDC051213 TaxID=3364126 RepID=UPI003787B917